MAANLNMEMPNFFIGFDLVGQEDLGLPLIDFAKESTSSPFVLGDKLLEKANNIEKLKTKLDWSGEIVILSPQY